MSLSRRDARPPGGKAGDIGDPDRLRDRRRSGRQPAWSPAWRGRAATSPVCRSRRPILLASDSNFCARSSPVSADWRSWPMSAIPPPCWRWREVQAAARTLGLEVAVLEIRRARISTPPSRRSRRARTHFMSAPTRSSSPIGFASTPWRWARDCRRCYRLPRASSKREA